MKRAIVFIIVLSFVVSAAAMAMEMDMKSGKGKMVRCTFSGMAMKDTMMKMAMLKGETLYFCSDQQKEAYFKTPEKYRAITKVGDLKATVNFMTNMEHMQVMKAMKMKMDKNKKPQGTHHIAVFLQDKHGKEVKPTKVLLRITDPKGKGTTKPLMRMEAMSHYGADFDLSAKGKYKVAVMVLNGGKQLQSTLDYTLK